LPKPSIFWLQAPDAEGKHLFRCTAQGEYPGSSFYLYQGGSQKPLAVKKALPNHSEVTFVIDGFHSHEPFYCSYEIRASGKAVRSPLSGPANITEDHYPKPSIAASPSTEVFTGQDWTVRCWASSPGVTFVLYQAREFRYEVTPRGDSSAAEFSLKNVTVADTGRYTCYYHSIIEPVIWSNASDGVQLRVIDAAEDHSYQEVLVDSAGRYRVHCPVPTTAEGWFYLYRDGQLFAETRAWQNGTTASFSLTEEALNITRGELSCQYRENQLNNTQDVHLRSTDFTTANCWRLGLGASLLLLALLFIVDACWNESSKRPEP
ncbi:Immunoglobulin superfamily member 1, partial [Varanus komodoensis]